MLRQIDNSHAPFSNRGNNAEIMEGSTDHSHLQCKWPSATLLTKMPPSPLGAVDKIPHQITLTPRWPQVLALANPYAQRMVESLSHLALSFAALNTDVSVRDAKKILRSTVSPVSAERHLVVALRTRGQRTAYRASQGPPRPGHCHLDDRGSCSSMHSVRHAELLHLAPTGLSSRT